MFNQARRLVGLSLKIRVHLNKFAWEKSCCRIHTVCMLGRCFSAKRLSSSQPYLQRNIVLGRGIEKSELEP